MAKGQLPKAYLRMSPNLDQTHPDPGGFVRLLCAAARQPHRGRFSSRQLLDGILGRTLAKRLVDRGDVVTTDGGRLYVDGWDEWQEGDLTVGERQARIRAKRDTSPLPDRDNGVTEPLENRDPPSRQLDSKTVDSKTENLSRENLAVQALIARGWRKVTPKQRQLLWEIADRHSYEWVAALIADAPPNVDLLRYVMHADRQWQEKRAAEIDAQERAWQAEKDAEGGTPPVLN